MGSPNTGIRINFKPLLIILVISCYSIATIIQDVGATVNSIIENQSKVSPSLETAINVYNSVKDSVVDIAVIERIPNPQISINGEPIKSLPSQAGGSGFLYDTKGNIVTNYHVVEYAEVIYVTFSSGNSYSAKVIGVDPYFDLAVIQIDPAAITQEQKKPLRLANSSSVQVGEPVVAIGSPLGLVASMSEGIVSQTNRVELDYSEIFLQGDWIQTDAAINFGNSGGPLLDFRGEVIGVNSRGYGESGDDAGLNFAIASNSVQRIVPKLISEGEYRHPWIGIQISDVNPFAAERVGLDRARGVLIVGVTPDSPAEQAGIKAEDIIFGVDNKGIREKAELVNYLETKNPDDSILLNIISVDGTRHDTNIRLEDRESAFT
jgi:S1-C subfamily serine protease